MGEEQLHTYRERLQQVVRSLGRSEIGVGEVTEREDIVHFSLKSGERTYRVEMREEVLNDPEMVLAFMTALLPRLRTANEPGRGESRGRSP